MSVKNFKFNKRRIALLLSLITLLPGCSKKQEETTKKHNEVHQNTIDDFDAELSNNIVSSNASFHLTDIDSIMMQKNNQDIMFSSENVDLDAVSSLPFKFISNSLLTKIGEIELIDKKYDINTVNDYFMLYKTAIKNIMYSIEQENVSLVESIVLYESLLRKIYNTDTQIYCECELETNGTCELLNNIFQVNDIFKQYLLDKFSDEINNSNDNLNMNDIANSILDKFSLLKIDDINSVDIFTVNYQIIKLKELLNCKADGNFTYTLKKY